MQDQMLAQPRVGILVFERHLGGAFVRQTLDLVRALANVAGLHLRRGIVGFAKGL